MRKTVAFDSISSFTPLASRYRTSGTLLPTSVDSYARLLAKARGENRGGPVRPPQRLPIFLGPYQESGSALCGLGLIRTSKRRAFARSRHPTFSLAPGSEGRPDSVPSP